MGERQAHASSPAMRGVKLMPLLPLQKVTSPMPPFPLHREGNTQASRVPPGRGQAHSLSRAPGTAMPMPPLQSQEEDRPTPSLQPQERVELTPPFPLQEETKLRPPLPLQAYTYIGISLSF